MMEREIAATGHIEIDNSKRVLDNITRIYSDRLMSDVCLVVGGVEYHSHRLILCASSDVFEVMLMDSRWSESQMKKIVLQESQDCTMLFGSFLKYFYTGNITLNYNSLMPFLILADKYNVKDLVALCVHYMCEHIPHAANNNSLISWFQYSLSLGHYKVAQACENFVKWNFEFVASKSDFGYLHPEVFLRLLKQNDMVVRNEFTVYECVVRWLETQCRLLEQKYEFDASRTEMENLVHQVMEFVRFPMMTPRQLAELLLSPLIQEYKEFFIKKMAIGMAYHNNQTDRVREVAQSDGKLMFTPRLYTTEKWCTSLLLENYPLVAPYHIRTLVLSSHTLYAEHGGEKTCDWIVDVFPKGVWFRKSLLIVWQGTVEVPESVLRTVRVSVTCKNPPGDGHILRVKIGLLVWGIKDGVEHIMTVITRNHHFSEEEKVLNLDDIISFDELNAPLGNHNLQNANNIMIVQDSKTSPFLVGKNRDILKIQIVIAPLTDECCVDDEVVNLEAFMKNCEDIMIVDSDN